MANGSLFNGKKDPNKGFKLFQNLKTSYTVVKKAFNVIQQDKKDKPLKIITKQEVSKVLKSSLPNSTALIPPQLQINPKIKSILPDYQRDKALYDIVNKPEIQKIKNFNNKRTDSVVNLYRNMPLTSFNKRILQQSKQFSVEQSKNYDTPNLTGVPAFALGKNINLGSYKNLLVDKIFTDKKLQNIIDQGGTPFKNLTELKSDLYRLPVNFKIDMEKGQLGTYTPSKAFPKSSIDNATGQINLSQKSFYKDKQAAKVFDYVVAHELSHGIGIGNVNNMINFAKQQTSGTGRLDTYLRNNENYNKNELAFEFFADYNAIKSMFNVNKKKKNLETNVLFNRMQNIYKQDRSNDMVKSINKRYGQITEILLGRDLYGKNPTLKDAENLSKIFKQF